MSNIKTENIEGILMISVIGEVDASSSIHLDNAFKEAMESGQKKIVTNLTELDYISSAGLGVFISYLDEFSSKEVQLVLFGIKAPVRQVFDILGLGKLLKIVETKEEALQSFNE